VLTVLEVTAGLGVDLTERAAAGVSVAIGTGFFDGPFVGISGMCYDYGLRAALGGTYDLGSFTTIGAYYQTRQHFQFDNAIRLALPALGFSVVQDVEMDLPENVGFGIADNRFLDGNLLLAMDVLYKRWDDADLFAALYDDQWVVQFGAQLTSGRSRCRLGYVWAENPIDPTPGLSAGGVTPPGAVAAIQYAQGLMAVTGQHRISAGFQRQNVLPGLDLDLFAGGMFKSDQQLGAFTATSIQGYWIGLGLTWRFRCVCGRPAAACGGSCGGCCQ
jgi:long-chain fatty acid transport protein